MKRILWLLTALLFLSFTGCKEGPTGPTRCVGILNNANEPVRIVVETVKDSTDVSETRLRYEDVLYVSVPLEVCNVFVFGSDDKVRAMIFEYDFSKLDSNSCLFLDATEVTPYASFNPDYIYRKTDYLVKPFKYDASRIPTAEQLQIEWYEAGEPFVASSSLEADPGEMEKELSNLYNKRWLIPVPAGSPTEVQKIAYIDKFVKDLGTSF